MRGARGLAAGLAAFLISMAWVGEATAVTEPQCLAAKKDDLNRLYKEKRELEKVKFKTTNDHGIDLGKCTKTVAKMGLTLFSGKADSATVAHWEAISCVQLDIIAIQGTCKCQAIGQEFSIDKGVVDDSVAAYKRMSQAQRAYRSVVLANPAIRKLVGEASEIRDCYNLNTIKILNSTAEQIEKAAAGQN